MVSWPAEALGRALDVLDRDSVWLLEQFHKRTGRSRQVPVASIDQTEFAHQIDVLQWNQLHPSRAHIVARESLADQRNAEVCSHKALDHGHAGQFHRNTQIRIERPKILVQHLSCEPRLGKDEWLA